MTALRYSRRPHPARHVMFEYHRAARDWTIWRHACLFLIFIALLVVAVLAAGGRFEV